MSVLLIGASGRTGLALAARMHMHGAAFRALIRRPAQQAVFTRMGAQAMLADLREDFSRAFEDMTTAIYAAGSAENEGAPEEQAIDRDAVYAAVGYARDKRCKNFVMISTLLAGATGDAKPAMQHYAEMKKEADDHVIASGLRYLIMRPGTLTQDEPRGKVGLIDRQPQQRSPVSRIDVAHLTWSLMEAGIHNKIVGFSGGDTPIDEVVQHLRSPG